MKLFCKSTRELLLLIEKIQMDKSLAHSHSSPFAAGFQLPSILTVSPVIEAIPASKKQLIQQPRACTFIPLLSWIPTELCTHQTCQHHWRCYPAPCNSPPSPVLFLFGSTELPVISSSLPSVSKEHCAARLRAAEPSTLHVLGARRSPLG